MKMASFMGAELRGFVMLPLTNQAAGLPECGPGDPRAESVRRLWGFVVLRSLERDDGLCELTTSARRLSEDSGLDRDNVRACISFLVRCGAALIVEPSRQRMTIYMRPNKSKEWPEGLAGQAATRWTENQPEKVDENPPPGGRKPAKVDGKPATKSDSEWPENPPRVAGKPAKSGRKTRHQVAGKPATIKDVQGYKNNGHPPTPPRSPLATNDEPPIAVVVVGDDRGTTKSDAPIGTGSAEPPPGSRWARVGAVAPVAPPEPAAPPRRDPREDPDRAPVLPLAALGGALRDVTPEPRPRWAD